MNKIILIHGNGNSKPTDNWLPYIKAELEKLGQTVIAPQFPDTALARARYWLPFLKDELKADAHTILVGHSSGAIAALRYAEENPLHGTILVGAYHSHLNNENEKLSGYFDAPWNWDAIRKNQQWIVQFADTKDPWIPIEEARYLRDQLHTEYYESNKYGHFGGDHYKPDFPELLDVLKRKLQI